ncbi:MAG: AI-2E family transporter [Desulfomonile tiedjei]|uniref:AI-2E family transporter n=1 Tax=Desulfomonile tiedjei TaxID=2358 RepID=A0A9D6Z5N8_9BACT|nr:AI-2E family transporter [Desulfomonile tiedjei]
MKPQTRTTLLRIAAGLVFAIFLLWLMSMVENVTVILMVAFFLAYILNPAVNRLESWGLTRSVASLALIFSGVLLFVVFLLFFVPSVVREIASFAKTAPRYWDALEAQANWVIHELGISVPQTPDEFKQLFLERWKQILPKVADPMAKIASSIFSSTISLISFIFYALLVPIISYYLMVSFEQIRQTLRELIPPDTRPALIGKLQQIDSVLAAFVRGQLTVSLILAVLYSIGFVWIGIDLAIVLGVTSGLLFVIPYFGTMIGIVGGSLMALAKFGDLVHVGYVLGWIVFVQLLEGYVITPRVVGQAIGLNPVVYILALIVGGNLFGIVGMLIAIPVTAVLKVLLLSAVDLYRQSYIYSGHEGPDQDK